MSIWRRCFGERELEPLNHLIRQKRIIEQRGCFSDRELDEKYYELDVIERRIEALKHSPSPAPRIQRNIETNENDDV